MLFQSKLRRFLKSLDLHGHSVSLTYKNRTTFKTLTGGIVTLISCLVIFVFFCVMMNRIIEREKRITIRTEVKTPNKDLQEYPLDFSNFDLAVTISFFDELDHKEELDNLEKYITFEIEYGTMKSKTDENG